MILYNMYNNKGINIIQIGLFGTQKNPKWAFSALVVKFRKIVKCLFFNRFQQTFFLRLSEFRQESNGAKIKILAIKIKDLEKSRIMNA